MSLETEKTLLVTFYRQNSRFYMSCKYETSRCIFEPSETSMVYVYYQISGKFVMRFYSFVLITTMFMCEMSIATNRNGFDLDSASIPINEILQGGPGKDGIPAIDSPEFIQAADADFLKPDDRILGLTLDGKAKAYPVKILDWHEVVNDSIGDRYFAVTFCPLCGTGLAFETSKMDGADPSFGVSGLLYQSDVLLYDRASESLWSQLLGRAVTGDRLGELLQTIPIFHTSWEDWISRYPDTQVLGTQTGYRRDYNNSPYADYGESRRLYFDVSEKVPDSFHPKEQVLGLEVDGHFRAYPFSELQKQGLLSFKVSLNGEALEIHWNPEAVSAYALDKDGNAFHSITSFWFAWYAFHPKTSVFIAQ